MAINLNDNIKIFAGKPSESKYLSSTNTVYSSIGNVNAAIPITLRHIGLTVNVGNVEYWYKDGVTDGNLIEKIYSTLIPITDYITGGTNVGYFSGQTGIQTLPINHLYDNDYDGKYNSLYNYYYRGGDGIIHVGTPKDGIIKRGYLKSTGITKSFIWSEYTGGTELVGWALLDVDISKTIGVFQYGNMYYDGALTFPYTGTSWTTSTAYNNGSDMVVDMVTGSLTTGSTITIGGRPFAFTEHNNLHFKTIVSDTPSIISVTDNESFIYLSGQTSILNASNVGSVGATVYSGLSGTTLMFKRVIGSGDTTVFDYGNRIVIYSSGDTISALMVTGATNGLSVSNKNVRLGGTLLEATTINLNNNRLSLSSDSINQYGYADFSLNCVYANSKFGICSRDISSGSWGLSGNSTNISSYHCTNGTNGSSIEINNGSVKLSNKISSSVKTACLSDNAFVYASDYSTCFINRSLVDKEYVDNKVSGASNIINVNNVGITYTTTATDDYVGICGANCVYLYDTPRCGQRVIISDICGNAGCSNIYIDGNGICINNGSTSRINTNYGSITYIYNGIRWSVSAFVN